MDERKLNTEEILASGIMNLPTPKTEIPENRVAESVHTYEESEFNKKNIIAHLLNNKLVHCSEYYGVVYLWQEGNLYRGNLLQYRQLTEDETFENAEEAVNWFMGTSEKVSG
jgi:hypothetical protein